MVQGTEQDILARLSARLDAQERLLAAQEGELVALRATVAGMQPGEASIPPLSAQAVPTIPSRASAPVPTRTRNASRRTLLKGAGAALFTTALLATGEIVPVAPFRVAAAAPYPTPTRGAPHLAAVAPDTLYQTYIGTDFQPETTFNGYTDPRAALHSVPGRSFRPQRAPPASRPG